jgi:anaerobic selenocysteine-containing dehydrogenase
MPRIDRRRFLEGSTAALALTLVGLDLQGCTAREAAVEGSAPERWSMSVCPYCGVGCGLEVGSQAGKVVAVRGMADHPVNRGEFCLLAKNLVGILDTPDRLLHPMRRGPGGFKKVSWEDAAGSLATQLGEIIKKHGPDSVAMYVSASEYIEEYAVYNRFMKGCLGTNNLESSARLCWASGVVGLVKAFGADSPPCAYEDLDHADLFFSSGYNLSSSKPIFFKRLMAAKSARGTPLIVVDPRTTDTARMADLHLQIRPGTDIALHNAISHVLISRSLMDESEARELTDNYDALAAHVADFTPEKAAEITGVPAALIIQAAEMIGAANAALFMWGQGLNQSSVGTRKVTTLLNLVFITGNVGRPGAGPMAITGQTSAMGLREVGALPHLLPGFRTVANEDHRREVAEIWGVDPARISPNKGKPISALLEGIEAGTIKALWVIHSNPAVTFPDSNWVREVLSKVELLVVQDCYHPTETGELAHLLLPGAQWAEKGGTLTNSERGLNLIEAAVKPPGEARPDLDIVIDVARRMGFGDAFPTTDTEAIFERYKRTTVGRVNDISGVTYARLRVDKGIQWPVPSADHPGTVRRFVDKKFPKGKVSLGIHDHQEPVEPPDEGYPLLLITGLVAMQFHSRTRTAKVEKLRRAAPEPLLEIHPDDAAKLGVADGDTVDVESRRGSVRVKTRFDPGIRPGAVFLPYHFGALAGPEFAINSLTLRAFDEFAKQPEYKACAVRVVPT